MPQHLKRPLPKARCRHPRLKQQLEAHLNKKSCANCHAKIDPFGVPFEQYDVIGKFRTSVKKVDQEELQRRIDEVQQRDPVAEFKQIDTDGSGYISKDEWFAHVKAQNPGQKHDDKTLMQRLLFVKRHTQLRTINYTLKKNDDLTFKVDPENAQDEDFPFLSHLPPQWALSN